CARSLSVAPGHARRGVQRCIDRRADVRGHDRSQGAAALAEPHQAPAARQGDSAQGRARRLLRRARRPNARQDRRGADRGAARFEYRIQHAGASGDRAMTRYTYQQLVTLVDGDTALIDLLVEEGEIERRGEDVAIVDIDRVLVARTLLRDLDVTWPG